MALKPYRNRAQTDVCANGSVSITANNSTVLDPPARAIYVGGTGDLAVRMAGDATTPIFVAVPAGTVLPISVDKVLATGTTATGIVGLL